MSKIRASGTGIEKAMLGAFKRLHVRGYKYLPKMFGKPDFAFPFERIVVFCDGDFWHGYNYNSSKNKLPTFWKNKIESNMKRDRLINKRYKQEAWDVLRFWEHDIEGNLEKCLATINKHRKLRKRR